MNPETNREAIMSFYKEALTFSSGANTTEILQRVLADNFRSVNGQETKDKAALIKQFETMRLAIPDLKFEPKDKVVDGNKVVVRSVATGSPKGPFMGLSLDGSKSFKIDTVDIHTLENGQIVEVYHIEDWATALRQLS